MKKTSVFISYSSKDNDFAQLLCSKLSKPNLDVWLAPSKIEGGDQWSGQITKAIEECDYFILLASSHSIGNKDSGKNRSPQVHRELSLFDSNKKNAKLIPLDLDGVVVKNIASDDCKYLIAGLHFIDCRNAYQNGGLRWTQPVGQPDGVPKL